MYKYKTIRILIFAWTCFMFVFESYAQTYTWGNVAFGGGGYVSGIITHKTSGDVYCRTDVGGAYRWDATNSKWIPLLDWNSDDEISYQGVEAIAIDPQNANNVYIYAGMSYFNNGKSAILKSTDKGNTFTTIITGDNSSGQFTAHGNRMGRSNGERLAVDPNNSNILFCGTGSKGLWKSTDAGLTWTLAWNGVTTTPNENGICFVVFDPGNVSGGITQTIYLGVSRFGSTNVYRSTDGGTTFSALSATLPTTFMPHRAALNGNMLYITYANGSGPHPHWNTSLNETCDNGQVWSFNTSTSAATNITPVTGKAYSGVSVDPANANRLIVSTTNSWSDQFGGTAWGDYVYLSTNGGSTWTQKLSSTSKFNANGVGWTTGNAIHWTGSIDFDPLNTAKVRIISGNGLFTCDDINAATTTWKFDSKGIEETVTLDAISIPGGKFISAVGDVYGAVYSDIYAYPAQKIMPTSVCNISVAYAANNTSKVVRASDKIYYSTNQGTSWTQSVTTKGPWGKVALSADGNTILHSPEYKNSGDPTTTYYSTNNGGTWTSTGVTNIQNAVPVADFVNTNKFYIYNRATSQFLVSTNKGVSFTASTSNPGQWGSQLIRAVPGNEGHVWVALYGSGLKYTTNNGTSWTTVSNITYCAAVGFGKTEPSATYPTVYIWGTVGGVKGLFRSINQGVSWTRVNDDAHEWGGPGNGNFVMGDMNVYGRVYMSTVGRGLVVGDIEGTVVEVITGIENRNPNSEKNLLLNAWPNPSSNGGFKVEIKGIKEEASLTVSDILGRVVEEIKVPAGVSELTLGEHLSPGIYYLTIRGNASKETIKLIRN
ncbi:T9SS type A sorting domain-containing protein [Ohtaekwangia koreensis]|uniref:Por secretion system C-terminal sorting domain-containing protein n=1 Tax=Ohtaekwangia koreensis TaxID=688867 RepID=A0A1T5KKJ6_9BACT|nr:T9SS type A sorting domain-containing protein [Ohtaekwangia koreensis]SKC63788.1 Por secretion system C-terminal sorting domain-containing protein [Ohtaekwangia koreensis]